jgi:hypothetical protein
MLDTVHVDKTWFFLNKPTVKCYMAPDEEEPEKTSLQVQEIPH